MTAERPGNRDAGLRAEWVTHRERGSIAMLRLMTFLSLHLGRPASRLLLHGIAAYFFLFAPAARRASRQYLRRALGREPNALDRYRQIFWFASTIHDRLYLINDRDQLFDITVHGEEIVKTRLECGEGALLLGAHFGSFEVMRAMGRRRRGLPVSMAMYEENARKINAVMSAVNPRLTPDIIALGTLDCMLQIRARLDSGTIVGVLADRTFGAEPFERVPFLGSEAYFPTGAMRAAAILRRPVIFMAGIYRGGNRYHAVFDELADFSATNPKDREAAIRSAIRRYAAVLERHCAADPYNWFNFFNFWQEPHVRYGVRRTRSGR